MYIFSVLLPIISFFGLAIFGTFFKQRHLIIFNILSIGGGLLISIFIFFEVILYSSNCEIQLWNWISLGILRLTFNFYFDYLTAIMLIVVYIISFLVHLYSVDYMGDDPFLTRFLSYLSLFTFFMLLLITAGNLVQLFFGWEGVGLSSYLLINFWFTRIQANKSAMKAIIVNRFGDFGLYFALSFVFLFFNNFDFNIILSYTPQPITMFGLNSIDIIVLLLLLAAVGKSAQIGLHTWLADAMEGPTPVSALIHAATMVTAGIVLLIRNSFLLENSPIGLFCIVFIGSLTVFFAGTIGIFQNDIKKIIAFSTCSQLGYMLFACGLSAYNVSLFHLFNHAFFKALLFLGAGSVIHALADEQDIRKMGGIIRVLPVTYISMFIGSLALMGIPFLSGFYSKDLILEIAAVQIPLTGLFVFFFVMLSVFFTAFYSVRLLYLVFFEKIRLNSSRNSTFHESAWIVMFVFIILSLFSLFSGYLFKDLFVGPGINYIWLTPIRNYIFDAEFGIPFFIKILPFIFTIFGSFFSLFILSGFLKLLYIVNLTIFDKIIYSHFFLQLYRFFNQQWFFNYIYNIYLVKSFLWFSYFISLKLVDRGFLEYFGPFGLVNIIRHLAFFISKLQTGYIFNYIVAFIIGIFLFLNYLFFSFLSLSMMYFIISMLVCFFLLKSMRIKKEKK